MKREVSLEWLLISNHKTAKKFREVASKTNDCVLCHMFFDDEVEDENGNVEFFSFDELCDDDLEHFQQIADSCRLCIKIVSLYLLPEEEDEENPKEKVQFI